MSTVYRTVYVINIAYIEPLLLFIYHVVNLEFIKYFLK